MRNTINRHTLANGLRVVHYQDSATAMVALNVMYNTGARDESPSLTGLAHLFEHCFFGGSQNVSDFDDILTAAGGESNAWTSNDFTVFHDVAPAHNAETLFYIESDRMLHPLLTPGIVDTQRSVVIEEFKQQCLNQPYGDTGHHLRQMVYDTHPYSWPVIGKSFEHLQNITPQHLRDWHNKHYAPDNAVLAITGNISADKAFTLAEKWFGPIPRRITPARKLPIIADLGTPKHKTVYGNVPTTALTIAFLTDGYGTTQYYAADAITDYLAAGKASLFFRKLIIDGDGTFTEADASITGSEDRGMLLLSARLANPESDPLAAVNKLIATVRTVATNGMPEYDLQRLKNKYRSMSIMGRMDYVALGQRIAAAEMHNSTIDNDMEKYLSLTQTDIAIAAKDILDSNPAVLVYKPSE